MLRMLRPELGERVRVSRDWEEYAAVKAMLAAMRVVDLTGDDHSTEALVTRMGLRFPSLEVVRVLSRMCGELASHFLRWNIRTLVVVYTECAPETPCGTHTALKLVIHVGLHCDFGRVRLVGRFRRAVFVFSHRQTAALGEEREEVDVAGKRRARVAKMLCSLVEDTLRFWYDPWAHRRRLTLVDLPTAPPALLGLDPALSPAEVKERLLQEVQDDWDCEQRALEDFKKHKRISPFNEFYNQDHNKPVVARHSQRRGPWDADQVEFLTADEYRATCTGTEWEDEMVFGAGWPI